jgi:hypothetical protein
MKNDIVLDATLCSRLEVKRRFGGIFSLHIRIEEYIKQEIGMK